MLRVLIIQAEMKDYRVPFFTELHETLRQDGIELKIAYSGQNDKQAIRKDSAELPPEFGLKVNGYWIANRFLYQSLWRQILKSDLVIVGSENKYLINPFLLVLSALRLKTVAYWGLGPNMHPDRSAVSEWIKAKLVTSVDWWFAYTKSIADYLRKHGMPPRRITNVQNATNMRRLMKEIENENANDLKATLTGTRDSHVGLYCGLLGPIKELPLLLDAARLVHQSCPEFHLVIIGTGPDRKWLEQAISAEPWIHYVGKKFGREFASYFKMADVFLLSGTAGLAIVDSFAAGLPVIATEMPTHPPEISYIVDGENGRVTSHTASALAGAVIDALTNPTLLHKLSKGAEAAGSTYTIEAMVENFSVGIRQCLSSNGFASRIPAKTSQYQPNNVDA